MIKQDHVHIIPPHQISFTFRLPVGHWLLDYSCFRKMTSPFRNPQNESTAVITIGGDTPGTEKESSQTKFKVHENQPTLNSNSTPTRMFLRRRIVLLTLALILAIVIITVTIVGLLISSYNDRQQAEAEARKDHGTHMEIEKYEEMEKKMSSIASDLPESDDTEIDERDFLPVPPATTNTDSSGSGFEPSSTEKTSVNENSVPLTDEYESSQEVGSGDSFDHHQAGSGDKSEDRHFGMGSGDFSGDRRDVGSGFEHNQPV